MDDSRRFSTLENRVSAQRFEILRQTLQYRVFNRHEDRENARPELAERVKWSTCFLFVYRLPKLRGIILFFLPPSPPPLLPLPLGKRN